MRLSWRRWETLHRPEDERINPDGNGSEQGGARAKLSFSAITLGTRGGRGGYRGSAQEAQ